MSNAPNSRASAANKRLIAQLLIVVVGMFAFGFALVPLYDIFCDLTGLNGKTAGQVTANSSVVDKERWVKIEFLATNNNGEHLPWDFRPMVKKIRIHPGENKRIAYFAKNNSNKEMTVQAIPSVTPGIAAKYLRKTECFCFNQQTLKAGESMEMPLIFHVDRDLPKDIGTVTLSYTIFDINSKKTPS